MYRDDEEDVFSIEALVSEALATEFAALSEYEDACSDWPDTTWSFEAPDAAYAA